MKHGYVKAAALTPGIRVADTVYNTEQIKKGLDEAFAEAAKIIVFPELCITGYTCQDLVFQETLLKGATEGLKEIREYTRGRDALVFVGLPLEKSGKLFNVAAVLQNGKILAFIPKETIPNYGEFYEARYFVEMCIRDRNTAESRQAILIPEFVRAAEKYLEQHFREKVPLQELADMLHVDRFYLIKEFGRYVGISPHEYQIELRISYAKELLKYSDLSVNEIAYACGMNQTSHFISLFREREHSTPARFRKEWRPGPAERGGREAEGLSLIHILWKYPLL